MGQSAPQRAPEALRQAAGQLVGRLRHTVFRTARDCARFPQAIHRRVRLLSVSDATSAVLQDRTPRRPFRPVCPDAEVRVRPRQARLAAHAGGTGELGCTAGGGSEAPALLEVWSTAMLGDGQARAQARWLTVRHGVCGLAALIAPRQAEGAALRSAVRARTRHRTRGYRSGPGVAPPRKTRARGPALQSDAARPRNSRPG